MHRCECVGPTCRRPQSDALLLDSTLPSGSQQRLAGFQQCSRVWGSGNEPRRRDHLLRRGAKPAVRRGHHLRTAECGRSRSAAVANPQALQSRRPTSRPSLIGADPWPLIRGMVAATANRQSTESTTAIESPLTSATRAHSSWQSTYPSEAAKRTRWRSAFAVETPRFFNRC